MSSEEFILFIDKDNLFGEKIGVIVSDNATIALVSAIRPTSDTPIVHIPFTSRFPNIPEEEYSHIIFVWKEEEKHLVDPLVAFADQHGKKLIIICHLHERQMVEETVHKYVQMVNLFVVGDTFSGDSTSELDAFLIGVKQSQKIQLVGMGLYHWYPVLVSDVEKALSQEILKDQAAGHLFFGPAHPTTSLAISHSLQKIDPSIRIDFSEEIDKEITRDKIFHSAFPEYPALEKIQEIYKSLVAKEHKQNIKEEASIVFGNAKKKKKGSIILYAFYVCIIGLLLPLTLGLIEFMIGGFFLSSGVKAMSSGDFDNAKNAAETSRIHFQLSQDSISIGRTELQWVGQGSLLVSIQSQLRLSTIGTNLVDSAALFAKSLSNILVGKAKNPAAESVQAISAEKQFFQQAMQLQGNDIPSSFKKSFVSFQELSQIGSGIMDELPNILGVQTTKTYLILFQNNMELRPGGGFIGSYALLHLDHGKIKNFTIHDVYDADGQLKGHIEPPFPVRRFVPIIHLYLRDSNFDPDFENNALVESRIFSDETGEQVDGIAAIDLNVLKSLLTSAGPVFVPSYNQNVTNKNFFTLLEEYSEKDFFPGSSQKKDFLQAFSSALFSTIQAKHSLDIKNLLGQLISLIQEKHVAVTFSNQSLQVPFQLLGLTGSMNDIRPTSANRVNDFFGIVEANFGANKVNAYITRSINQQITIDDKGKVHEDVKLRLNNNSDGTWPGGPYKTYLRFILQDKTSVEKVIIDNVEQKIIPAVTDSGIYENKSFVPPAGLEVMQAQEKGKMLYGFLVNVLPQVASTVDIQYTLNQQLPIAFLTQDFSIQIWKQMGIDPYPYTISISYPNSLSFLNADLSVEKLNQAVLLDTTISSDTLLNVSFTKK